MVLVIGANGMLGQDLMALYGDSARGVDLGDIDITDSESVRRVILSLKPKVVINSAAYTDVDGCETNSDTAMAVNGEGVGYLAMITKEIGALLVQISTDYVFDGSKGSPYQEDDLCAPMSVYGESKLVGELNSRVNPNHIIIRTQWLYGHNGKNFVETMLKISQERDEITVVDDQFGSPTWTVDLANAIKASVDSGCRGTYHAAGTGVCSWNEFARAIFEESGVNVKVLPLSTEALNRPAKRPLYSSLDCSLLAAATGRVMPLWRDSLEKYLSLRKW